MKIGIYGYGNLGRGAEIAISDSEDAELIGIFTRRDPRSVVTETRTRIFRDILQEQMRRRKKAATSRSFRRGGIRSFFLLRDLLFRRFFRTARPIRSGEKA